MKLTKRQLELLVNLYVNKPLSMDDISYLIGVSRETLNKQLQKMDVRQFDNIRRRLEANEDEVKNKLIPFPKDIYDQIQEYAKVNTQGNFLGALRSILTTYFNEHK